jgi:hypothetical protein
MADSRTKIKLHLSFREDYYTPKLDHFSANSVITDCYLTLMTDNGNRQESHLIDLNIKGSATSHHVTKH